MGRRSSAPHKLQNKPPGHFPKFNLVTTVWHCVVGDGPGHVIVASNYLIEEAAILILRNDLYTGARTRDIVQSKSPAARGDRTV